MPLLKSSSPSFEMSTPSIKIDPWEGSIILRSERNRVDFPDPVLPTTPIYFFKKCYTHQNDTFSAL